MKPLRPYLYSAYYQWLVDNNLTPYLLINAEYPNVDVPKEFIKDGKIILNISPRSIGQYVFNDEGISFNARFQGILRDVYIPLGAAEAIYAQETSDGIMFQSESYYDVETYLDRASSNKTNISVNKRKTSHLKILK